MAEVSFRTLSRNSIYAAVVEFWRVGSRFILTPIVIGKLGLTGYGTWTLIFSICGYADVLNTSFANAYSKYTAEFDRKRDYESLSQIISSGVAMMGALGLLGWTLVFWIREPILAFVRVPESLFADAVTALPMIAGMMAVRLSFGCFFQVLAGLQRLDLQHKLNILASVVEFVVTIVLLMLGYGLTALVIGHISGQLLAIVLAVVICRIQCPSLRCSPTRISRFGLKKMVSLGGRFQLLAVLGWAITDGLKLLIGRLCSVPVVAQYDLAEKLLSLAKSLSSSIIAPLMPAFANLHAGQDHEKRFSLYMSGSKIVALTAMASLTALVVFAEPVLIMWTGRECPEAAWTIRLMALGQFLWLMTGVGTASLRGSGTVRLEITNAILRTIIAVAAMFPLYDFLGYPGIVLSVLLSRSLSALWFLNAFARFERLDFRSYSKGILLTSLLVGGAGVVLGLVMLPVAEAWSPDMAPRWRALFQVLVWGTSFGGFLSAVLWCTLFSRTERGYLLAKIQSSVGFLEKPERLRTASHPPNGRAIVDETPREAASHR